MEEIKSEQDMLLKIFEDDLMEDDTADGDAQSREDIRDGTAQKNPQ